ncbi:MAG: cation-translocating P-type ATPase [Bacillota bacterium]|nr:cation-translocating P-type ATPase [Bacillota bacterium]
MYENKSSQETLSALKVDPKQGLSSEEAKKKAETEGLNKLYEKPKDGALKIFFSQFADPMTYILGAAALISLIFGIISLAGGDSEGWYDIMDVFIIFGVLLINATIGTVQEMKAEKALEALKKMSAPTATVIRDGKTIEIKAEELVVGDIVILEEGRTVPADLRLFTSVQMKVDESSLTGESVPAEKDCELVLSDETGVGDRVNCAFMSTPVVYGHGSGVVVATGMHTEIGKIASMLSGEEQELTPLQKKLAGLSKFLAFLTAGVVLAMLIVKLVWSFIHGNIATEWPQDILDSVALAVAAIPEGLTAVVTIVLAMSMGKMIKVNTIVRKLASVETLGAVSVICSDKTGTLTQNKMTVVRAYANEKTFKSDEFDKGQLELLAKGMSLCSDAKVDGGVYGDPTEVALVQFANDFGMHKGELESVTPRVDELPFDSVRKMMSTQHQEGDKKIVYTKGAMDQILKHANKIIINGEIRDLTKADVDNIEKAAADMASDALRVLALAISYKEQIDEDNLIFVGLTGMVDPPRPAAKPAVATLKKAGITTIMITGDHRDTAFAIAKELGIAESPDQVMSGAEIDECDEKALREKVEHVRVFARVSPENKVQIVKAIKANGHVAAMTGDGVNDAPSLKAADIGIAMGITGTDVAKGAADMVLTDDNFASIEKAVEEGRGIYFNIRKTIIFLISSNIGEVVCMLVAAILGLPSPLIAIHLLWVNLITDSLPAIALGIDKKPNDIMSEKPREADESLFAHGGYLLTFGYGVWIGLLTLLAFLITPWQNGAFSISEIVTLLDSDEELLREAQSMAFCALSFSELFHLIGMVNPKKSFVFALASGNKFMYFSFILGFALQIFVIYTPGVNDVFRTAVDGVVEMKGLDFLWVLLLAASPLLVHEIGVLVQWIMKKHQEKASA